MQKIKSSISFIAAALVAAIIGIIGIKYISNMYTLELSIQDQEIEDHFNYINSLN